MYARDEIKTLVDKALNMTVADGVELSFDGGERAGTPTPRSRRTWCSTTSS
jgi:hypothetical protein